MIKLDKLNMQMKKAGFLAAGAPDPTMAADPSMMGGMPPPMDPMMMGGGAPPPMPMDPSMMGGAPLPMPMDPTMMGGSLPMPEPTGETVTVSLDDLRRLFEEVSSGGDGEKKETKSEDSAPSQDLSAKVDTIARKLDDLLTLLTSSQDPYMPIGEPDQLAGMGGGFTDMMQQQPPQLEAPEGTPNANQRLLGIVQGLQ